jgi:hypothetical protein
MSYEMRFLGSRRALRRSDNRLKTNPTAAPITSRATLLVKSPDCAVLARTTIHLRLADTTLTELQAVRSVVGWSGMLAYLSAIRAPYARGQPGRRQGPAFGIQTATPLTHAARRGRSHRRRGIVEWRLTRTVNGAHGRPSHDRFARPVAGSAHGTKLPSRTMARPNRRQGRGGASWGVHTQSRLPSASAMTHQDGANRSSRRRPPADSTASTTSRALSCAT